jgi:hypothetical protein
VSRTKIPQGSDLLTNPLYFDMLWSVSSS